MKKEKKALIAYEKPNVSSIVLEFDNTILEVSNKVIGPDPVIPD